MNTDRRMANHPEYQWIETTDLECNTRGCLFDMVWPPHKYTIPFYHGGVNDPCYATNEANRRLIKRERTLASLRENANVFVPWGQRA